MGPSRRRVLAFIEPTGGFRTIADVALGTGMSYSSARTHLKALDNAGYVDRVNTGILNGHAYMARRSCKAEIAQCDCHLPPGHTEEFHECECGGSWAFGSLDPDDSLHFRIGSLPGLRTMMVTVRNRPFNHEVRVLP